MDMLGKTFYFPTFTNHLMSKFGLSIETSSFFYMINMVSYFSLIKYLDPVTQKYGLKLTLLAGLFSIFVAPLFLPPIPVLPQFTITIIIGLIIQGVGGAAINVPAICDLIEILKTKMKYDDAAANDMASAIYNLGLNFGEAIGPTFGGYVTEKADFQTSCIYVSFIMLGYFIFFGSINYNTILKQLEEGKRISSENKAAKNVTDVVGNTNRDSLKKRLTDDDYDNIEYKNKSFQIDLDRKFVGRYRSYSYSNRSSKRSSFAKSAY